MTLALRYAVRSDVGLLREGNEDSAYAGPHLLAVADGMGGHAAGEVASAATITTIAPLDAEDPGPDLVGALDDAVARANLRLQELIISDPAIEGMGTTLTALLWSDGYAALCHIGDSRAYLLRENQFVQITHDHTLVQSLVDEGKITEDDVATHPHRSLLLRALDGRTIAEPDLVPLETYPGDRYLLCSDGLSGVVTEETLHQTLTSVREPDKAAMRLVELAIKGGGPDNITCIVADVIDTRGSRVPPTWQPVFAGAAANGAPSDPRSLGQNSPATRAMRLTRTAPQPVAPGEPATGVWPTGPTGYHDGYTGAFDAQEFDPSGFGPGDGRNDTDLRDRISDTAAFERPSDGFADLDDDRPAPESGNRGRRGGDHRAGRRRNDGGDDYGRTGRRRWPVVTGALVLLVLLIAGGGYGFWQYNQGQYYIGVTPDGHVAIFRGTNENLAGISLSTLLGASTLKANMLTSNDQATLAQTISESSSGDAEQRIYQLQVAAKNCQTTYQQLATWQTQYMSYQNYLRARYLAAKAKAKLPAVVANPEAMPSPLPTATECAPSTAFGIATAALPTAQEGAAAATPSGPATPPASPSATASGTAAPHTSVPATSTAPAVG
jgi:PPM family protein phosphatase